MSTSSLLSALLVTLTCNFKLQHTSQQSTKQAEDEQHPYTFRFIKPEV